MKDLKKKNDLMFAVRLKKNKTYIGNIRISDIDHYNKKPNIHRITGLLNQPVIITNSALKAFFTFVVNGFKHIICRN